MLKTILLTILLITIPITENKTANKYCIGTYASVKQKITDKKLALKTRYNNASTVLEKNKIIEEARALLTKSIADEIIPYWYGTKWSFEGHTEIPKSGEIACGYFVSTTLNHTSLNINRFKLAQKSPKEEAKTIQIEGTIEELDNTSPTEFRSYFLKDKKDGLYFAGLDYHVGYLLKENNEIYFIHSNYINSKGVAKEKITESKAFESKKYSIAPISNNNALIKKWILSEVVKTN